MDGASFGALDEEVQMAVDAFANDTTDAASPPQSEVNVPDDLHATVIVDTVANLETLGDGQRSSAGRALELHLAQDCI